MAKTKKNVYKTENRSKKKLSKTKCRTKKRQNVNKNIKKKSKMSGGASSKLSPELQKQSINKIANKLIAEKEKREAAEKEFQNLQYGVENAVNQYNKFPVLPELEPNSLIEKANYDIPEAPNLNTPPQKQKSIIPENKIIDSSRPQVPLENPPPETETLALKTPAVEETPDPVEKTLAVETPVAKLTQTALNKLNKKNLNSSSSIGTSNTLSELNSASSGSNSLKLSASETSNTYTGSIPSNDVNNETRERRNLIALSNENLVELKNLPNNTNEPVITALHLPLHLPISSKRPPLPNARNLKKNIKIPGTSEPKRYCYS